MAFYIEVCITPIGEYLLEVWLLARAIKYLYNVFSVFLPIDIDGLVSAEVVIRHSNRAVARNGFYKFCHW